MKFAHWMKSAVLAFAVVSGAQANTWPERPVQLIVPYPAGAGVDPVARLVGQKLSERWGQPVVVQNKAGASGSIGAAHVARSKPDGLTIMMSATAEVVINQFVMKEMSYDPGKDLAPVTLAVRLPFALVGSPKAPYSNVAELVAYAKEHPEKLTYSSSGNGTPQHLAAARLEQLAGIKMTHVPYKGVAPSISAQLAGEVDLGFVGLPAGMPHIQAGSLKPLAVSGTTVSPAAPEVPPVAQTPGLEAFDLTQWFGIFVPTGTPEPVIERIQQDFAAVLAMPDVREQLLAQGAEPSGMPTEEFRSFVDKERKKFGDIVKAAGL